MNARDCMVSHTPFFTPTSDGKGVFCHSCQEVRPASSKSSASETIKADLAPAPAPEAPLQPKSEPDLTVSLAGEDGAAPTKKKPGPKPKA